MGSCNGFRESPKPCSCCDATLAPLRRGFTVSFDNRSIIRRHIVDLTVLAATTRCAIGESSASAVVATRLAAALDYIASHFSDPELSLAKVAQSQRISPRYLQRLLESSGTCYIAHVIELRLKRAFTLLTAENSINVRIGDIALQAGFSDISYFNWLFRSRFGDTPKGVRAHAQMGSRDRISENTYRS